MRNIWNRWFGKLHVHDYNWVVSTLITMPAAIRLSSCWAGLTASWAARGGTGSAWCLVTIHNLLSLIQYPNFLIPYPIFIIFNKLHKGFILTKKGDNNPPPKKNREPSWPFFIFFRFLRISKVVLAFFFFSYSRTFSPRRDSEFLHGLLPHKNRMIPIKKLFGRPPAGPLGANF